MYSLVTGKYRSHTDIVASILTNIQDEESPTKIMKKANLNFRRFNFYVQELVKVGLVEVKYKAEFKTYNVSQKGFQYLTQYNTLINLLK